MDWEPKAPRLDLSEVSSLSVGAVLRGKYRICRRLGSGGMSEVYEAEQMRLGRRVAVKVLRQELCDQTEFNLRFEREARAAARLKSRHVAQVLDVDNLEDGSLFLVFEYLHGEDLGQELERRRRLPIGEAVHWLLQACEAMAEAHALGIVHRDLKPENLFLHDDADGRSLKVLDFGVSKLTEDTVLTRTQAAIGTPLYMSPEQINAPRSVDHRADIWSLGVVLYEMLTGRLPFHGKNRGDLALAITRRAPPRPRKYAPELPEALVSALERALEKEPSRRYQSVEALARDLRPFAKAPAGLVERSALNQVAIRSALDAASEQPFAGKFAVMEATVTRRFEAVALSRPRRSAAARRNAPAPQRRAWGWWVVLLVLLLSASAVGFWLVY